jgi:hypothetical protein
MSDFFARLGARHAAEAAIRPRAVSRFESATLGARSTEDAAAPDAGLVEATASVAPSGQVPAKELRQPLSGERDQRDEARADGRWLRAAMPTNPVSAPDRGVPVLSKPAEMLPRAASDSRAEVRSSERSEQMPLQATEGANDRSAPRRQSPAIVPRVTSAAPTGQARVRDTQAAEAETAREPDVIRVHIGRVEVRAVMPTPRPQPRSAQPSTDVRPMSLDRYLNAKDRT